MAKFIVLYEKPKDVEGFQKHYNGVHMPLVEKMPNIQNSSQHAIVNAQNTDANYYLIAELEFASLDDLHASLSSEAGKQVADDAANLAPFLQKPPIILITE
ncbi:EthD family reductase [Bacillus sp. V5-8f]|uniref:EthD family reductase n=1 Tax=Bacillus sp. V5-8f TaxID=2053044 RepID=UPI000C78D408|nr:EthD family reductase [Bacillus sp. V5-8f]PLT33255.1 EthD family reductase [Bacillus sp. V5-8f]